MFLTHLHSDHVSGLPDFWLTGRFDGDGRATPLEVYGPTGTEMLAKHLAEAYSFDLEIRGGGARPAVARAPKQLSAHDVSTGTVLDRNGVRVIAFLVDHGRVNNLHGDKF